MILHIDRLPGRSIDQCEDGMPNLGRHLGPCSDNPLQIRVLSETIDHCVGFCVAFAQISGISRAKRPLFESCISSLETSPVMRLHKQSDRIADRLRKMAPCLGNTPQALVSGCKWAACAGFCTTRLRNRGFPRRIRGLFGSPWGYVFVGAVLGSTRKCEKRLIFRR